MTINKTYRSLIITMLLMMLTIIFYALGVTRLTLQWGIAGIAITAVFSIVSSSLNIKSTKHEKNVKLSFWASRKFEILDWFTFLMVSLMGIFMVFTFLFLPSDVQQYSMYPTLKPGERIIISHFQYRPERGDIVIIEITKEAYPLVSAEKYVERNARGQIIATHDRIFFVKRLVGMPGDLIMFVSDPNQIGVSFIIINNEIAETPDGERYYVQDDQKEIINQSVYNHVLLDGKYLVLGDNANGFRIYDPDLGRYKEFPSSFDSRGFGAVCYDDIIGKVIFRMWPIGGVK